jgi:hypothetical protein
VFSLISKGKGVFISIQKGLPAAQELLTKNSAEDEEKLKKKKVTSDWHVKDDKRHLVAA